MFEMTNALKNEICKIIDFCLKNEYIRERDNVDERAYLYEQLFMHCCCDIMKSSQNILINEQKYDFHFEILNLKKTCDDMLIIIFVFNTIEHNSKCKYKFFHAVDICDDNEIYDNEFSKNELMKNIF